MKLPCLHFWRERPELGGRRQCWLCYMRNGECQHEPKAARLGGEDYCVACACRWFSRRATGRLQRKDLRARLSDAVRHGRVEEAKRLTERAVRVVRK